MLATHIPLAEIRAMSQRDHENLKLYLAVKGAKDSGGSIDFDENGAMIVSSPDPQSGMGQAT